METRQQVFDLIVRMLEAQGQRCFDPSTGYVEYSYHSLLSPIGFYVLATKGKHALEELRAKPIVEPDALRESLLAPHRNLLLSLESMHSYIPPADWHGQLHAIAAEYDLTYKDMDYSPQVAPWTGKGLPPAGTHCEVCFVSGERMEWRKVEILLVRHAKAWFDDPLASNQLEGAYVDAFRPIDPDRDKWVEKALELWSGELQPTPQLAEVIYESLANGEIQMPERFSHEP